MQAIDAGEIEKAVLNEDRNTVQALTKHKVKGQVVLPTGGDDIVDRLLCHGVELRYEEGNAPELTQWIVYGVFVAFAAGTLRILANNMGGMGKFGKSNAKYHEIPKTGVTFADVAGVDSAKHDLMEIVDFLKTPEKYSKFGAKIPRGCLLVGSPGVGKTLLARAVAGEAGVPFFSCCASSFMEMFVGVGASRVRDLFKDAKKKAPCIIFIDEIDAVRKARSSGNLGGHDERDQTINQLLTEMDGFERSTGIIVIAATNRPEILDEALLRPGRFDRQITVDNPDVTGRVDILKIHTKSKLLNDDVSLESIARGTTGMSGADLQNLTNEAAITAARNDQEDITADNFDEAFDKIALGAERKTMVVSESKRRLVAVHEIGHTLAALTVGNYDNIKKVTVIPRSKTGGVTMFEPSMDRIDDGLVSKAYLESHLVVALGGRAAEEIVYGDANVTTGASQDIALVENIARAMVMKFGLSDTFGPMALTEGRYSQQTAYEIDLEVKNMVTSAYKRTIHLLQTNRQLMDVLTEKLLEKETLTGDEIVAIQELFEPQTPHTPQTWE